MFTNVVGVRFFFCADCIYIYIYIVIVMNRIGSSGSIINYKEMDWKDWQKPRQRRGKGNNKSSKITLILIY